MTNSARGDDSLFLESRIADGRFMVEFVNSMDSEHVARQGVSEMLLRVHCTGRSSYIQDEA